MVDVYLEGLVPRVRAEFDKLKKPVPKRVAIRLSDAELAKEKAIAEKEKKDAEKKENPAKAAEPAAEEKKEDVPKENTAAPVAAEPNENEAPHEKNEVKKSVKKAHDEKPAKKSLEKASGKSSEKIHKPLLLKDGTKVSNLSELRSAVSAMHIDMFNLHLNFQRNDFADWVERELKNKALASRMRKATSKKTLLDVIKNA